MLTMSPMPMRYSLLAGLVAGGNDSNHTYAPGPTHPARAPPAASQPAAKSERPVDQPIWVHPCSLERRRTQDTRVRQNTTSATGDAAHMGQSAPLARRPADVASVASVAFVVRL